MIIITIFIFIFLLFINSLFKHKKKKKRNIIINIYYLSILYHFLLQINELIISYIYNVINSFHRTF